MFKPTVETTKGRLFALLFIFIGLHSNLRHKHGQTEQLTEIITQEKKTFINSN